MTAALRLPAIRPALPGTLGRALAGAWPVLAISLILLAVTALPTLFGYLSAPPDRWFSGVVYNMHDTTQYLSWMREAGRRLLTDNKMTAEPTPAIFINLHWWIPGRVAGILGWSPIRAYLAFRLLSVPLYVALLWWVSGLFFADRRKRRFAFWLTTLTSGLGWVWVVHKYALGLSDVLYPHDLYTTPGNSFWVMVASPHLTLALALTVGTLGLAWSGVTRGCWRRTLAAAGLALFLGLGHIYDLVTVWTALAAYGLLLLLRQYRKRGVRKPADLWPTDLRPFLQMATIVLVSLPAPLYFGWVASPANPLWRKALQQYDNLGAFTPDPLHLTILLGLTFLVALVHWLTSLRGLLDQSERDLFLKGWFPVNLVILYLPLHFAIMLLTGFQFVLAALATDALFDRLLPWLRARWPSRRRLVRWVPALFLLAVLPTNLYLFAWRFVELRRHDYPFYLSQGEIAAIRWLEANADPDDVVLSAFTPGHFIPGLAGTRAFLSNAVMTMDFVAKRAMVQRFFQADTPDEERRQLLTRYGVDYVFYGPAERALGAYEPDRAPFLEPVFEEAGTAVYRVLLSTPE